MDPVGPLSSSAECTDPFRQLPPPGPRAHSICSPASSSRSRLDLIATGPWYGYRSSPSPSASERSSYPANRIRPPPSNPTIQWRSDPSQAKARGPNHPLFSSDFKHIRPHIDHFLTQKGHPRFGIRILGFLPRIPVVPKKAILSCIGRFRGICISPMAMRASPTYAVAEIDIEQSVVSTALRDHIGHVGKYSRIAIARRRRVPGPDLVDWSRLDADRACVECCFGRLRRDVLDSP